MAALASIACICLFPVLSASAEDTANADAAAEQTGWIREDGRITYRFADGHTASGETEIETGMSTDSTIEVTSGLTEGETVYYTELSGSTISSSTDSNSQQMMGGMPSGDMGGGGGMPSGGGNGGGNGGGGMPSGGGQGRN